MTLLSTIFAFALFGAPTAPADVQPYKVLYAGKPSSTREQAFVGYLKKQFTKVESTDLASFQPERAKGYDVVFLDFRSGDTEKVKLGSDYKTPTVVTGWAGVFTVDEGRTKGSNYW
jgi:hypothetical protein